MALVVRCCEASKMRSLFCCPICRHSRRTTRSNHIDCECRQHHTATTTLEEEMQNLATLLISIVLCASSTSAFHRSGGTAARPRTRGVPSREDPRSPPGTTLSRLDVRGQSSMVLFASRQFRNVEEMLDSFEKEMVVSSLHYQTTRS